MNKVRPVAIPSVLFAVSVSRFGMMKSVSSTISVKVLFDVIVIPCACVSASVPLISVTPSILIGPVSVVGSKVAPTRSRVPCRLLVWVRSLVIL